MISYAPVAVSGSVVQGPQQEQQPAAGDRSNGNGGMRKEWWWQAGPVDSYWCCFTLSTGVALLGMSCLVFGISDLFFSHDFVTSIPKTALARLQDQYARSCEEDSAASTPDCEELKERIGQAEGRLNASLHLLIVVYVAGFLRVVAGVAGLWAVFFKSRRAAKVFMLSWPARFLLEVWGALEVRSMNTKYDVEQGDVGIVYLIDFVVLLYYFKVSWSYYKRRVEYSYDAPPSGRGRASSDTAHDATPMLATNTTV